MGTRISSKRTEALQQTQRCVEKKWGKISHDAMRQPYEDKYCHIFRDFWHAYPLADEFDLMATIDYLFLSVPISSNPAVT
jgi:hypothetical protein